MAQASTLQIPNLFKSAPAWSIVLAIDHKLRCSEHGTKRRHWFVYVPYDQLTNIVPLSDLQRLARYAKGLEGSTDSKDVVATGEL